ncbi:ABC transporter permease subunit [Tistrella bauzanensis]|uniref:ABC transporter permease subunit n=1 Tax=Tistrella arctica TaxID=3133430 RepID=A0ABU9YM40_9PROT
MFPDLGTPLRHAVNDALDWLIVTHGNSFEAAAGFLLGILGAIEGVLRGAHPAVILGAVVAAAFAVTRRPVTSVLLAAGLWGVGALGLWDQAMQTVALMLVAVSIAALFGLPIGILMAKSNRMRAVALPVLDFMQTIPIFVYLLPAAMLFGLGKVPAVFATVIYAMPPLVRLTDLGLRGVDHEVREAANAFGASRRQLLFKVELPLALPTILQGLNQTTMLALGMVVVASMIGARGLGETVLVGLQRNDSGMGLIGGLGIVALAMLLDRMTQGYGRRVLARRGRKADST